MARTHRNPEARSHVVEAARRAIAAHGLRGATVRAIAHEAGVLTGYVTHYFETKQQLALAALDHNNLLAGQRALQASRSARGLAAIAATIEALLPVDDGRRLEWSVWIGFWTAPATDPGAATGLQVARDALATILAGPFADAVDDGELPAGLDFAYEAERLMVLASGIGLLVNGPSRDDAWRLGRRMLEDHLAQLRSLAADRTSRKESSRR